MRRFVLPNASEKTLLSSDPRSVRRRSQRSARRHAAMLANLGKRSRSGEAKGPRGPTCPHGRANRGYYCKECPGKGICEHGRQRKRCKECGGSQICEHGRERSKCKECVRSSRVDARDAKPPIAPKVEIKEEFEYVEDPGEEDYSLQ